MKFVNGSEIITRGDNTRKEFFTSSDWDMYWIGWDIGLEDITVITHSVSCCKCGKAEHLKFQRGDDIVYLADMLKELNWTQDKYGRWFCDGCSYPGGDD